MMYIHPSAQVHGAKVQNNYGLCKIFAKIHKKNRSKANLGLSKNTAKTWQKMKLCSNMVGPFRLYATQLWAKFASYGLAVQWLMNE